MQIRGSGRAAEMIETVKGAAKGITLVGGAALAVAVLALVVAVAAFVIARRA